MRYLVLPKVFDQREFRGNPARLVCVTGLSWIIRLWTVSNIPTIVIEIAITRNILNNVFLWKPPKSTAMILITKIV